MRRSVDTSVRRLQQLQPTLWIVAVGFYGIGDLVTTAIGLRVSGVVEASPVVGPLLDLFGVGTLFVLKGVTLTASYAVWHLVPDPHRTGVPLGLAVVGVTVTGWNIVILSTALLG